MQLTTLNRETKKAKRDHKNAGLRLRYEQGKENRQHLSTVEPFTADTIPTCRFYKDDFVKISADSTPGIHSKENSACVGTVVRTDYSTEEGFNKVTVMVHDGRSTMKVVSEKRVDIASKSLNNDIIYT